MPIRFPVRRFVHTSDKIQAPSSRWGRLQWVLSRALYRFHTVDLGPVPARNRAQALQLALIQWTPFARSAYYIGWQGDMALVWAWDADRVEAAWAQHQLPKAQVQVLPETLLRPPQREGLVLLQNLEGCEAQVWRQGVLMHSRWWPQTPAADEWLMFQRDAALGPQQQQVAVPAARTLAMGERPWLDDSAAGDPSTHGSERLAFTVAALALFAATCWYGATSIKLRNQIDTLTQQKAQLQSQATPIAQARGQALDDLARVQTLRALNPHPEQLLLMAKVAQSLPPDKSALKDWDFQNGQLKFTLTAPADISASALIAKLQQDTPLREVKALSGRDQKSVSFQADVQRN